MSKTVYLAGPMQGKTLADSTVWRLAWEQQLSKIGVTVCDPTRNLHLRSEEVIQHAYEDNVFHNSKVIVMRDLNDVRHADVVFCNMQGRGDSVSIGSLWECAVASEHRIPVVMMIDKEDELLQQHPFIQQHCLVVWYRIEALELIRHLLNIPNT